MTDVPLTLREEDLDRLAREVAATRIDYCEIVHRGRTVLTHIGNGYSTDKLHRINSITKSVLSLLVGIALDRGEFPGLNTPIADFFPEARHTDKQDVTVEHLLTMTPGWDWREMGDWHGLPTPMIDSPDWIAYILSRPMVYAPGSRMVYDSGCSQMLSAILQRSTALTAAEYAERHLFQPLGIEKYSWRKDPNGIVVGGFGLELRAPDLTRIGRLMLDRGTWKGSRIVSEAWINASASAYHHTYDHIGSYGYHWWVMAQDDKPISPAIYFAVGYGGQYIFVVPELELIVVFASTLYKKKFQPYRMFKRLLRIEET